ncbi:hypothetical protein GL503_15030 [Salmonella enterica]|nr:hypothetical protein [Salmonella enterica]EBU8698871.1 hypothetical protein [Salmonella enterica subsp. enterica serovar Kokomlemle]EEB7408410.1 hypothetical protein [Salmonella enterica]
MELHEFLDDKANAKIISYVDFREDYIKKELEKYDSECHELSEFNRRERRKLAKHLQTWTHENKVQEYIDVGLVKNKEDISPNQTIILNSIYLLELHGYTKTAKKLYEVFLRISMAENQEITKEIMNEALQGAIRKNRSSAASGYRHHLHDEIVAVMTATWAKNPALSKRKMISKLLIRYEDRIDEGTLNSWIKKENLAPPPPPPGQHKNSSLVIPPEYA